MIELKNFAAIGNEIALAWEDGSENYVTLDELRKACPCAKCKGEPDAMGRIVRPQVFYTPKSFNLVRYQVVGGYAIQLFWADGHSSGIYTYDLLRQL